MLIYKEVMCESKDPIDECFSPDEFEELLEILLEMPVDLPDHPDCKQLSSLPKSEKQDILNMLRKGIII
jgi:hypothetical protein